MPVGQCSMLYALWVLQTKTYRDSSDTSISKTATLYWWNYPFKKSIPWVPGLILEDLAALKRASCKKVRRGNARCKIYTEPKAWYSLICSYHSLIKWEAHLSQPHLVSPYAQDMHFLGSNKLKLLDLNYRRLCRLSRDLVKVSGGKMLGWKTMFAWDLRTSYNL